MKRMDMTADAVGADLVRASHVLSPDVPAGEHACRSPRVDALAARRLREVSLAREAIAKPAPVFIGE
jgi:hypothetical protein